MKFVFYLEIGVKIHQKVQKVLRYIDIPTRPSRK